MGHLVVEGGGSATSLLCGTVRFDGAVAHPVLSLLPQMICFRDLSGHIARVVQDLIHLISQEVDNPEPGSEILIARLTDVLLVYVLRGYINDIEPGQSGWLGALKDPSLRAALDVIHSNPTRPLNAGELAQAAGMSRSAFFSRFRDQVGMTPGEYQTRWRVHLAAGLLRGEDYSVGAASRAVGYGTEAAFSNAFLKVMGVRPGAYRRTA